jgi:hypothetical protein
MGGGENKRFHKQANPDFDPFRVGMKKASEDQERVEYS